MHLIHLTYQILYHSLAYLKHALVGQNLLTPSLFYNEVLNMSCVLLNTILKVKNRMLVWVHNGCVYFSFLPWWPCGELGALLAATALYQDSFAGCTTTPGKDQNLKFKVWVSLNVYHFGTIVKLKNCESNCCKLGMYVYILVVHSVYIRCIFKLPNVMIF